MLRSVQTWPRRFGFRNRHACVEVKNPQENSTGRTVTKCKVVKTLVAAAELFAIRTLP